MLRLLFYVLFVVLSYKVFRWALKSLNWGGMQPQVRGHSDKTAVDDLVKDPVCGTYVPVKNSVSTIKDGKQVHFCSESCLKKFLNE